MLELKNMSGFITNSSSEVFIFSNASEEFSKFLESYQGDLNFITLRTREDVEKAMTSPTAQEKLLEYVDIFGTSWMYMDEEKKKEVTGKLIGRTFLFNSKDDPEEDRLWYLLGDDREEITKMAEESYVG